MSEHILTNLQDRILKIEINRPAKKNALTVAMYAALAEALEQGEADSAVRVIYITGAEGAFTSGNDIMDFVQNPPFSEDSPVAKFLHNLTGAQKPIVAAVNGIAIGVGATMLLHCDLAYAAESARFHLPFVNLGLVPEAASSYLLPQMVGHRKAAELILLGDSFSAQTAREIGLVNAVYADAELAEQAWQKAQELALKPPAALRLSKSLLKRANQPAIEEAIRIEAGHFVSQLQSQEAAEAFQAFMERRPPDFSKFS